MAVDARTLEGGDGALFLCEESMPFAGPILPQAAPRGKKCLLLSTWKTKSDFHVVGS
jgi:hypothetical protein